MQVEPVPGAGGRYRANLATAWDAPVHPSGGLVTALALRAMQAELGSPRNSACAPSRRCSSRRWPRGRSRSPSSACATASACRSCARRSGIRAAPEPGHVVSAAFGESRKGVEFSYSAAPEVGPPEDYPPPAEAPDGTPVFRARFFENVETRRVRLFHSFETGWEGGRAEAIRWIRYRSRRACRTDASTRSR